MSSAANDREPPLVPITWLVPSIQAEFAEWPHERTCEVALGESCTCGRDARIARIRMLLRQVERHGENNG